MIVEGKLLVNLSVIKICTSDYQLHEFCCEDISECMVSPKLLTPGRIIYVLHDVPLMAINYDI